MFPRLTTNLNGLLKSYGAKEMTERIREMTERIIEIHIEIASTGYYIYNNDWFVGHFKTVKELQAKVADIVSQFTR